MRIVPAVIAGTVAPQITALTYAVTPAIVPNALTTNFARAANHNSKKNRARHRNQKPLVN
jgi:hypothetical protein